MRRAWVRVALLWNSPELEPHDDGAAMMSKKSIGMDEMKSIMNHELTYLHTITYSEQRMIR